MRISPSADVTSQSVGDFPSIIASDLSSIVTVHLLPIRDQLLPLGTVQNGSCGAQLE